MTFPDPEKPAKASDTKNPVFEAAFAKLKAKAEANATLETSWISQAEARGELPAEKKKGREKDDLDARGGVSSSASAPLKPVSFFSPPRLAARSLRGKPGCNPQGLSSSACGRRERVMGTPVQTKARRSPSPFLSEF